MLKKILSYLYPITVYSEKSEISGKLKVLLYNGSYLLDTLNTNYSYGSLEKVLKKGLDFIGENTIQKKKSVLILGVAGGSVVKTLVNDFNFTSPIKGVELDANIIRLANKYFELNKIPNFKCIIDDAQHFIANSKEDFDLIIIDIFTDMNMPSFLFDNEFINNYKSRLTPKGHIIFNMMWSGSDKRDKVANFIKNFDTNNYQIHHFKSVERYNDLFVIQSLG
jgi:spermidine synthase